jgi:putative oxidoreductase
MFEGVAARTFAPLLLRAALAAVFIYHGLDKVQQEKNFGGNWAGDMLPTVLQFLVAWGELLCGVAIALGLLTRVASLGVIVIMIGAIFTVTGAKGFSAPGGYELNFVLILVAAALVLTGAGTFSLDRVVQLKSRGPAKY